MKPSPYNPKAIISQQEISLTKTSLAENNKRKPIHVKRGNKKKAKRVKKIMIADDDPAIIDVLTLMLESAGYTVLISGNGKTVEEVKRNCPDVVLLDVLMSGVSGYDVCGELKNDPSTKHIPVIMISANKKAREVTLGGCGDGFIAKPFEMNNLLQIVARFIKE